MKVVLKPKALVLRFLWCSGERHNRLYRCRMLTDFRALGTSCPRAEQNRVSNWRDLHKWKSKESKCCRTSGAPALMVGAALLQRALHPLKEVGESLSECRLPHISVLDLAAWKAGMVHLPFGSTSWPPEECVSSRLMDTPYPGPLAQTVVAVAYLAQTVVAVA